MEKLSAICVLENLAGLGLQAAAWRDPASLQKHLRKGEAHEWKREEVGKQSPPPL